MNIKKIAVITAVAIALVAGPVYAQTTDSQQSLLERLRALVTQLLELQKQQMAIREEIQAEISANIKEGMTHEDVREIQEILATDKTIYPEGLVTGYFGPLTKNALARFQQKFELKATGQLDDETRAYLEELMKERFGDSVPAGLLSAPGIGKKIELRLREDCDNDGEGKELLCQKIKIKFKSEDGKSELEIESEDEDDDDEDEDDSDDDDDEDDDDDSDSDSN